MSERLAKTLIRGDDYDLAATLMSGQAFRWKFREGAWEGVIHSRWARLRQTPTGIEAEIVVLENGQGKAGRVDWTWLENYLQAKINLSEIVSAFPQDEPMRAALDACRGLRLLRQEPWECLASFILSSTKQIVQIQQIVALLCERFGEKIFTDNREQPAFAFPSFDIIAELSELDLRDCKMGFRAPYLLETAKMLKRQEVDLETVRSLSVAEARTELLKFPGVGNKIADCVLLFAYGFQEAFPVDVWVMKALRELYFPKRRVKLKRLQHLSKTYFGPNAGYAQQYLFHYMRTKKTSAISSK